MNEARCERIGWAVSGGFHLLLALVFILFVFELKPFDLNFTAITFSSPAAISSDQAISAAVTGGSAPLIELPRRPMLDETSPLLKLPDQTRQLLEANLPSEKPKLTLDDRLIPRSRADLSGESEIKRERAAVKPLPLSDEALLGERQGLLGGKIAGDEMFSVSWDGSPRTKISGNLPEFPPGVNRSALVRIQIEVAPDGAVVFTSPAEKSIPELERVSMEALKSWRFNPLDRSISQVNQKGIVTFIFELK